jgi:Protein of unknown function (DUF5131)
MARKRELTNGPADDLPGWRRRERVGFAAAIVRHGMNAIELRADLILDATAQGTLVNPDWLEHCRRRIAEVPVATRFLSLEAPSWPAAVAGSVRYRLGDRRRRVRPGFRPMDLDWARDIRDRCAARRIPLFVKQIGGRTPKAGGRQLDGRTWDQYPAAAVKDSERLPQPGARRCG